MTEPYLRLENISKRFPGSVALDQACLRVSSSETHGLMGANGAGKSTLMNVLAGIVQRDSGQILIDGAPAQIRSPAEAAALKIAFVLQELNMLPSMTVAENTLIGALPSPRYGPTWMLNKREMYSRAAALLERLGCHFSAEDHVENLGTGDRQMIEIARALVGEPRIIIFDEPTSSLADRERQRLFEIIRLLKRSGTVILYITHFLDEIFEICDRVTVMRNGQTVRSGAVSDFSPAEIVRHMIGDTTMEGLAGDHAKRQVSPSAAGGEVVLRANGISRAGVLNGIDLTLHAGEVVGLWGLLGSGRTELVRGLLGLDPLDAGDLYLPGETNEARVRPERLHREVGFVTEDRRGEGLFLPLNVTENVSLPSLRDLLNSWGLVDRRKEQSLASEMTQRLKIKFASLTQTVSTLSGGNQQKVVLARWLATEPRIFVFDEPTRGVDVPTKAEILRLAGELARSGKAVLLICSEIEEIMRVSHRYLVIRRGEIVAELPGEASRETLMVAAAGEKESSASAAEAAVEPPSSSGLTKMANLFSRLGFWIVLAGTILFFSFGSSHFLTLGNILAMLHTMAPVVAISSGMALLALSGKLDISVGSIAFLSVTFGVLLVRFGVSPWLCLAATVASAALLGALNGFIVVGLRVNPLIATLGTMIALRGIGLDLTNASVIPLPENIRKLGNLTIGPVFVDTIIIAVALLGMHFLHTRTRLGRQITAIGNDENVAGQLGIPVRRVTFLSFVLSGLLASLGGLASLLQVGSLSGYLGKGLEFTAVAVVVVGGISLFGGRGSFFPGVIVGAITFEMIANGLNQIGANPYVYRLITGTVIFLAMYADALSAGRRTGVPLFRARTRACQPAQKDQRRPRLRSA
jgi:ribose transport system ATP-binding protein